MILSILIDILDLSGTTVTLRPSDVPGAVAELFFDNRDINGPQDERSDVLAIPGMAVDLRFDWDADGGADAIIVTPPNGIICQPSTCVLVIPENETGTMTLWAWEGM